MNIYQNKKIEESMDIAGDIEEKYASANNMAIL